MSESWPTFQNYKELSIERKEIRILHLEWMWTLEILTGRFEHVLLDDHPEYDALSYCWGAAGRHETILLEGQRVYLRENAYQLLKTLCLQGQACAVWLDFLCIDQSSKPERSAQVSIMFDVFSSVQKVLSWLGPGDADSDLGLQLCGDPLRSIRNCYRY